MLTRARLVVLLVLLAVAVVAFATFTLLPRRYQVREQLSGIAAFWHEDEAFVFVDHHAMGRSTNPLLDRLPQSGGWTALGAMWSDWRAFGQTTDAYHVVADRIEHYELPDTVMAPSWDLEQGRLVAKAREGLATGRGFRWTGRGFERLAVGEAAPLHSSGARTLEADDQEEGADAAGGFAPIAAESRQRLKSAGWHFKHLTGYEGIQQPAALAMTLRSQRCTLSLRSQKGPDTLFPFATTVGLSGDRLSPPVTVLFADAGWRDIPRAEFDGRSAPGERRSSIPTSLLVLLVVWLGFAVLKVSGLAGGVLPFLGLKRRLVKNVATTMSFPPAIPEQFPKLDRPRLEATSRELEGLGFEKLLDTAPVTDSPTHPPTFCRIYAHRRHGCFGVIMQAFPARGQSTGLFCLLSSYLDDGWSVGSGNGQPLAASAFVRRPRAIGFTQPGAPPADLLARFLKFRDQVCGDLGVRPIADTRLETYIRRTLDSLSEIREAVKKKSMTIGLSQYYSRRLGLGAKRSQLVWLGDYPRIAEERRVAGLGPGYSGSALLR